MARPSVPRKSILPPVGIAPVSITYTPAPPWSDGAQVTRNSDGVVFIYSSSLNALTVDPSLAGVAKDAGGFAITNLPTTPTNPGDAASKAYVDAHAGGGGIVDAPSDGNVYARLNAAWTNIYDAGTY